MLKYRMHTRNGIGKDWANKILAEGYVADNRTPDKTTAKIWNKKTKKFNIIELSCETTVKYKGTWRNK